jgi:predicted NUDIX family NTP pyrophosphohydrolase
MPGKKIDMPGKSSAGLLLFRKVAGLPEVFLVHPGGPIWKNKDDGAWSIPKGEFDENEAPLEAAKREFFEETGKSISGKFIPLKPVKTKSGKTIYTWTIEKDIEAGDNVSNLFKMEWPPHSGKFEKFPEADKAKWFSFTEAKGKINRGQVPLLNELEKILSA